MLPSQGRPGTEDPKSTTDSNVPSRLSSSTLFHSQDSAVASQRQLAAANPTDVWFLPPTHIASSSGSNRDIQPPAASIVSSLHMIGPTSTFYDPDAMAQGQGDSQSQYQQWIDAYGSQQHQQHSHHQQSMQHTAHHHRHDSYQQQQPQAYRQDSRHSTHTSDQYDYTQHQYSQASHSHYVDPALGATSTQSGVGGSTAPLRDTASYRLQTTAGDPYVSYFSHSDTATGANTPGLSMNHPASYTGTTEPLYQHILSQPNLGHGISNVHSHSQSQSSNPPHPYISVQTTPFSSESLNSHPQSSHSSSLSPASKSWTEEVYPKSAISPTNIVPTATDMPAEPTPTKISPKMPGPSSSKPAEGKSRKHVHPRGRMPATTASSPDNTPKASAKRKRPNPGATPPQKLYRFDESGSGSEEDEEVESPYNSGGISVGMGGMGVVGGGSRPRL